MSQPGDATTGQTVPAKANCVVIGAGIVGNCLVGHLSRLGWTDMVQIDKGPLPNPGGSTGHASNFIFPTDHNKEMPSSRWRANASTSSTGSTTRPAASRWPASPSASRSSTDA